MKKRFFYIVLALLALAALTMALAYSKISNPELILRSVTITDESLARGKYLLYAGGCISCHSKADDDSQTLSGGDALETPFGKFYPPNITPDKATGIGNWSDENFIRAFRFGISPSGKHYYPAFPYPSYTGITQEDLLALKAYLFSLPPVKQENRSHELAWYVSFRPLLAGWKWLHLQAAEFTPAAAQSEQWNRGAYLVKNLGHCAECHTPRTISGGLAHDELLIGNEDGPEGDVVPNIRQSPLHGIGKWSLGDIEIFLEMGMLPDGDFTGGSMSEVIDDNTSQLTSDDRQAIAVYLKSLEPLQ